MDLSPEAVYQGKTEGRMADGVRMARVVWINRGGSMMPSFSSVLNMCVCDVCVCMYVSMYINTHIKTQQCESI